MISDSLFQCVDEARYYLREFECYETWRHELEALVSLMDEMRSRLDDPTDIGGDGKVQP